MPLLIHSTWLFRRRGLVLILLVASASFSSFGKPVFQTVRTTPYDHQMVRVSVALTVRTTEPAVSLSLAAVNQWMMELRALPYHYSRHWQTPNEVSFGQVGDCKGKALALYARMRNAGATNLRLVIGKHHIYDSATHAWLEWETSDGSYVLDPTFDETPVKLAELDAMIYLPFYAYDGIRKYRVSNVGALPPSLRVASGITNQSGFPVISPAPSAAVGLTPTSLSRSMTYVPIQGRDQSIQSGARFARPLGRPGCLQNDSPARGPAFAAGPLQGRSPRNRSRVPDHAPERTAPKLDTVQFSRRASQ
jgi:predicted transglutaminase-like cysteine proteinase